MTKRGGPLLIAMVVALAMPAASAREPDVRPVTPKRGGTKTTFTVQWVTEIESDNAGEQFRVFGPRGTRCHGLVAYTPAGYEAGAQTVRMGPSVKGDRGYRDFAVRPENPDPELPRTELPRWCQGVYRGRVDYENEDGEVEYVVARFRFRVK